jgi:hypothetical protein
MRSVVSQGGPGLLLFDEPSASLDPTAEHGVCLHIVLLSPQTIDLVLQIYLNDYVNCVAIRQ